MPAVNVVATQNTLNINASSDEKIHVREEFPKAVLREN